MSDHPGNPTLLVGLGAFGREVLALAVREPSGGAGARAGAPAAAVAIAAAGEAGPVVAQAKEALRRLLDLASFVESTAPADARGPRCDVFVIADLGEPGIAAAAPALASQLEAELRLEFRAILGAGEGMLVVCPLLSAPRAADRAAVAAAARALSVRAADPARARGTPARAYLVEDQSGKYLLSRAELVRSFAGFLHLVLYARLRDAEGGARPLIERERHHAACFATFACATLAFDGEAVAALCAVKLAQEVLRRFREGGDLTVAEIGAGAQALIPSRAQVEHDLWREGTAQADPRPMSGAGSLGSLEEHLAPPAIDVPEILPEDTPEDIVEHKLSPLWRAHAARKIAAYREDVERFKMDRLAGEMEQNGKACLERIEAELAACIDEEVARGPRGHARALDLCRAAHARAKADLEALAAEIESPDLAPFPESPLDAKLAAVEQAVLARPRRYRMKAFGALAAALGAVLIGGALRGGLRLLAAPGLPYFDPFADLSRELPWLLGRGAAPFALGAALAASSVSYRLWKHDRRHHNWVVEARDALDQALQGYLSRDVVGYFRKRLHYGRLLWLQRIFRRIVERLEEAIAALEAVRAALAAADTELARDEARLDERLDGGLGRGGILLRGLVAPADARAIYDEVRPPEVATLAARHLRERLADGAAPAAPGPRWHAAPFADPAPLVAFCRKQLADLEHLSPFADASPALRRASAEATRVFLRQLALKLSPPLELVEVAAAGTAQRVDRIAFVPPEAEALLRGILEEDNLRGGWEVRATSGDRRRVHLLVTRSEIELGALALAAEGASAGR